MKVLASRFQLCLVVFHMLTVKGCSQTGPLRCLSNQVFRSLYFRKYISYEAHLFFSKCSKFGVELRNAIKKWEKAFSFLYNWVWLGCCKFSRSPREYFSSALHVLKNSPKICNITRRGISGPIFSNIDDGTIWCNGCHSYFSFA